MNAETPDTKEYSLLIIDDELEITKALARQFRSKYNVFTATSADEGLAIMEQESVQVVVSDQRMPGMTGVDFFTRIKHKYPDALRLLLTGYTDIEAVINAINEGQVFRYVTKPWNPAELDSIIREAFEKYELITNNKRLINRLNEANQTLEAKVKERTKELEKANGRLSELNVEKNKYIGMVVHDLRNPIGVAATFADMLIQDIDILPVSDRMEYLGYVSKSCHYSLNLMNDFLDVSKIEAGIFDLNLTEQDYLQLVRESIQQQGFKAAKQGITIQMEAECTRLLAMFDNNKILQVLNNLIGNAVKYSSPNTTIQVRVEKQDVSIVTHVIDHGQGISEAEQSTLFKPYSTTSSTAQTDEKSTGLGLAIVKKIIDAHQGTVQVQSALGQGSVFTFTLPVSFKPC
jgi:signal transduction histidine kinase